MGGMGSEAVLETKEPLVCKSPLQLLMDDARLGP